MNIGIGLGGKPGSVGTAGNDPLKDEGGESLYDEDGNLLLPDEE